MTPFLNACNQLHNRLTSALQETVNLNVQEIKRIETCISISLNYLSILKEKTKVHKFISEQEEISFFKDLKPRFISQYIYHLRLLGIHFEWPTGGENHNRNYLEAELKKTNQYFDTHQQFYRYYRAGHTYLDEKYFLRHQYEFIPTLDQLFRAADPSFATSYDFTAGELLANLQFKEYIEYQLALLNPNDMELITWTESKAALVELMYGLYYRQCFNEGKINIKTIMTVVQKVFNIDLGNYHDVFLQIKMRKNELTKFLNSLPLTLVNNIKI